MASSKRKVSEETPEETHDKKERVAHEKYESRVTIRGTAEEKKRYRQYLKEHQRRIRRLEREARGEFVPGDYDDAY